MNKSTSLNRCPACGAEIPIGAPQGLCPKCLLAGLGQTQEIASASAGLQGPPPLEEVATAFPHLEILELVGVGGMGCVFKARQPKLERLVALKLLPAKFAADASFRERFSREARVLARLNHPNIVSVFDFGESGGFFFLLMEFVDGANLRQAMQAGRFTPDQALAIVPKICEALQFAHTEGILHRDIKPENILLDTKGRVKIADFGIAKLVGDPLPVTRLTATGAAIGTPQYMAPEQIEHPQEVDHRADIYSLGVVFYEMLTGELPIGRFAPPSQKTPMDSRVDDVVMRTLEKEREKRYQSAGEVKTSVEHLTTPRGSPGASTAPVFNPEEDFILCPPRLPRMAKAIIVYALVVAPLLWLVGLFAMAPLPNHALVGFIQGALNFLMSVAEFLVLLVLAVGAWRLRGLRPSGPGWVKFALWLHLGLIVLVLAGQFWVELVAEEVMPDAPPIQMAVSDGLLIAVGLASLVFEISALVWLRRHKTVLASFCQVTGSGGAAPGTGSVGPDSVPRWSRASIVGAVLTGLSLPLPVFLTIVLMAGMGGIGLMEILVLLACTGLVGVPGTILGWIGLTDIRAQGGRLRGWALAVFAGFAWPVGLLVIGTLAAGWFTLGHTTRVAAPPRAPLVRNSERAVSLDVAAPPHETFIVTGIVLSNGVPVSGQELRAKLWPPKSREHSPYVISWQTAEETAADGTPWEIVVEDQTSDTIVARLRPAGLPDLDWKVAPGAANVGKRGVMREAFAVEVARALQTTGGGNAGAVDWSVRLQFQSSPLQPTTSKRGIEADFVLPANQVATFELVTRSNGVIVPVPGLAAHQINGTPEPYTGKFILADDPDDLDSLTGLPRWKFGIIGSDGRLTSQGLAVPPIPADFILSLNMWKALEPDREVIEGMSNADSSRAAYGLRIRTQTFSVKPGLRHTSSGFGTNWMKDATQHLASPTANAAPWIRFTFTAVELREVGGTNWLAVDYQDDVHGACTKAFPWELTLPGAQAEVRSSEFLKDDPGSPAVRHQRIEYRLPASMKQEQREQLRLHVEKALKQKSVRLGLDEKSLLFGVSTTEGFSIKAWVEVKPPLPESP